MSAAARPTTAQPAPPWGFWGTALLGLALGVCFALVQTGVFIGALTWKHGTGVELERSVSRLGSEGTALSLAILGSGVVCTGLVVLAIKLRRGASVRDYLALVPGRWRAGLAWLGALFALLGLSEWVARAVHHESSSSFLVDAYATARPVWLLWLAVVLGAPVFEEAFFRGFLFKGLERTRLGAPGAVALTAAVFAVIHLQYAAFEMGIIFCLGLLLGAARAQTGSLFVPLALHVANNAVATLQVALER